MKLLTQDGVLGVIDRSSGVLVAADEPLGAGIAELVRSQGVDAFSSRAPLDAIQILMRRGESLSHVIISSRLPWAGELRDFLADDYPQIEQIMLAA